MAIGRAQSGGPRAGGGEAPESQPYALGDDGGRAIRLYRERRRMKFLLELAELFAKVDESFEGMLMAKWEIGRKIQREMAAEAYGDKAAFVMGVARSLHRSRSSVYGCIRLAEKWSDADALLWSVRGHIEEQLSEISSALDRCDARARLRTWRYVSRNILPDRRAHRALPAPVCAMAGAPGHVCSGEMRTVEVCTEGLESMRWRTEAPRQ